MRPRALRLPVSVISAIRDSFTRFCNALRLDSAPDGCTEDTFALLRAVHVAVRGVYGTRRQVFEYLRTQGSIDERQLVTLQDLNEDTTGTELPMGLYAYYNEASGIVDVFYLPDESAAARAKAYTDESDGVFFMRALMDVCQPGCVVLLVSLLEAQLLANHRLGVAEAAREQPISFGPKVIQSKEYRLQPHLGPTVPLSAGGRQVQMRGDANTLVSGVFRVEAEKEYREFTESLLLPANVAALVKRLQRNFPVRLAFADPARRHKFFLVAFPELAEQRSEEAKKVTQQFNEAERKEMERLREEWRVKVDATNRRTTAYLMAKMRSARWPTSTHLRFAGVPRHCAVAHLL